MKRIFLILLAVLCAAALLSGCIQRNEERYNAQSVATVNGESIPLDEYQQWVNMYASYFGIDMTDPAQAENVKNMQDAALNYLIGEKVKEIKIKEYKLDEPTPERRQKAEDEVYAWRDGRLASYREEFADQDDPEAAAQTAFEQYCKDNGYDVDAMIEEQIAYNAKFELEDMMTQGLEVTDDETRAGYDSTLSDQKTSFAEDTSLYEGALADGTLILYTPPGFVHVKHVLVSIPQEIMTEINTLEQTDPDAAQTRRDEELAKIKPTADEVYEKAVAGEDFDALIEQYGGDEGMTVEPNKTEGYLVGPASSMVPEFLEASLALKEPGEITEPVATMFGYHIIRLLDVVPETTVAYEDVKEQMRESLLSAKQEEAYSGKLEEWQNAMTVVINEKLL